MESQLIDINWYYYVVETDTFLDLFILLTMVQYPKMACFISAYFAEWQIIWPQGTKLQAKMSQETALLSHW